MDSSAQSLLERFPAFVTFGAVVVVASVMWMLRHKDTPWWLDALGAAVLLLIAAMYLGMLFSLQMGLPSNTAKQQELVAEYQVAMLIIPFLTAGIATNILSNIVTHKRAYDEQMPVGVAVQRLLKAVILAALLFSVVGLPLYFFATRKGASLREWRF